MHYDAPLLVIRKTKLVDLERENVANIKWILRWMMNMPTGDTEWQIPAVAQGVMTQPTNTPTGDAQGRIPVEG